MNISDITSEIIGYIFIGIILLGILFRLLIVVFKALWVAIKFISTLTWTIIKFIGKAISYIVLAGLIIVFSPIIIYLIYKENQKCQEIVTNHFKHYGLGSFYAITDSPEFISFLDKNFLRKNKKDFVKIIDKSIRELAKLREISPIPSIGLWISGVVLDEIRTYLMENSIILIDNKAIKQFKTSAEKLKLADELMSVLVELDLVENIGESLWRSNISISDDLEKETIILD